MYHYFLNVCYLYHFNGIYKVYLQVNLTATSDYQ